MHTPSGMASIPWRTILIVLAAATAVAWMTGFGAGLLVRWLVPWRW